MFFDLILLMATNRVKLGYLTEKIKLNCFSSQRKLNSLHFKVEKGLFRVDIAVFCLSLVENNISRYSTEQYVLNHP